MSCFAFTQNVYLHIGPQVAQRNTSNCLEEWQPLKRTGCFLLFEVFQTNSSNNARLNKPVHLNSSVKFHICNKTMQTLVNSINKNVRDLTKKTTLICLLICCVNIELVLKKARVSGAKGMEAGEASHSGA